MTVQEKKHKKPSAMAQVHNKVNAGIMDAVTCGSMCEAAEPEDEEYEIGMEDGGLEPYGHVNEATDCIPYYNLVLGMDNAYPFITFTKKDGTDTETFVGEPGEEHNAMPVKLLSDKKIKKEAFGNSLWDIKRDEYRSGRIWFLENGRIFVSFYSYRRSNYSAMYKDVVETLSRVKENLGLNFNIGKVIIDFWTFINGDDNIFVPVRWLNNGIADAYFKYMLECVPVGEDSFKLKTTRGNFVLDWKGNGTESINENKGKKTIYITEGQVKAMQTLLENEGTNLKKARNLLKARGFDEQQRQQILDGIRHDIPNSRLRDCKFILGVVRLYLERQLDDGRSIMSLNQTLKYIAMDSHVNEYDNNLNGESLDSLVSKFSSVAATDLQQSMQASNERRLTVNQNYKIVPIDSPEEAAEYADYVDWCVTQDEDAYNSYTSDGLGRFYFCLRNDFETVEREEGDGCPLDDYGLSMIAVSVNDDGSLNTVTCRWNHDAGGSDNVMSLEQLETILGRNFYQTFKPYTKEELRAKGLTPFEDIPDLLNSGARPEEIFKEVIPFGDNAYEVENGGKANFVRYVNGKYELCFDTWFEEAFVNDDDGFEFALIRNKGKSNFLLPNLTFLLGNFVEYAEPFVNGYAKIYDGERTSPKINLVGRDGSLVFPRWIDPKTDFTFEEPDAKGNLIVSKFFGENPDSDDEYEKWLSNVMPVESPGTFLSDKWYKGVSGTEWFLWGNERTSGYAVVEQQREGDESTLVRNVLLPDGTPIFGKYGFPAKSLTCYAHVMFVLRNESTKLFSTVSKKFTPWFDNVTTSRDLGFVPIRVERNNKVNYIDANGDFLSASFFDDGGIFRSRKDDPHVVTVHKNNRVNFLKEDGGFLSDIWFVKAGDRWTTDDFDHHDNRKRILVQMDSGVWYKLYEDGELTEFKTNGIISNADYNVIHYGYSNLYETKNGGKYSMTDYEKYIKSFIDFLRSQHLNVDPLPTIEFRDDEQEGLFIKTGYYSPDERKVVVYTDGRHPKDIMRTVAHEFVHHMQNLQDPEKDWGSNGDLEQDRKLRGIEGEAFLLGNIIFREWTEYTKKNEKSLNESKGGKKKNDKGETVPEKCDKCGGDVVLQIHGEPVYICKECGKYFGTMPFPGNLDEITSELVEPDDVDLSSFNIKKHLNPKFWDDGHLDTRIRLKLLDIADDFFDSLGVDWVEPEDVIITGSLANYNWNDKYSDIDLHILVDYEDVDERVDFVREYFTLKKNEWNQKHKGLRIFGFPVEVYVQDANEPHASSGVYSIDRDEWIMEPDREKIRSGKVNKKHIREMISTYMNKIDCLIDIYKHHKDDKYEMEQVAKDAAEIFDEIKAVRKDDLAKYGREMCDGNIIFKALRRADYIGKLIKLKNLAYDKINSL